MGSHDFCKELYKWAENWADSWRQILGQGSCHFIFNMVLLTMNSLFTLFENTIISSSFLKDNVARNTNLSRIIFFFLSVLWICFLTSVVSDKKSSPHPYLLGVPLYMPSHFCFAPFTIFTVSLACLILILMCLESEIYLN